MARRALEFLDNRAAARVQRANAPPCAMAAMPRRQEIARPDARESQPIDSSVADPTPVPRTI
jgi:hypothetical protein